MKQTTCHLLTTNNHNIRHPNSISIFHQFLKLPSFRINNRRNPSRTNLPNRLKPIRQRIFIHSQEKHLASIKIYSFKQAKLLHHIINPSRTKRNPNTRHILQAKNPRQISITTTATNTAHLNFLLPLNRPIHFHLINTTRIITKTTCQRKINFQGIAKLMPLQKLQNSFQFFNPLQPNLNPLKNLFQTSNITSLNHLPNLLKTILRNPQTFQFYPNTIPTNLVQFVNGNRNL